MCVYYVYQCAGNRTFATPKPNPPKIKLLPKTLVQKSQKLKKPGVLTVNILSSHKSAKISIFNFQKSRVPNKKEILNNQNIVVTGI